MDWKEKVNGEVDRLRPDITAFTQRLIQFPTLPGDEQAAQYFLAEKLRSLGCNVDILKCDFDELVEHPAFSDDGVPFDERLNVVGTWAGSGAGRSLILNGHMDVVPIGNLDLWQFPPFDAVLRDGKLHGRGACDMKAGLAAGIFAIEALQRSGFRPEGDVVFESVIGEESGGVGTLTTIMRGFTADAAVIMEPTRLRMCPLHSGALCFRLTVSGRAIHASMKQFGVSAIEKFTRLFAAIEALDAARHAEYENPMFEFKHNVAPICVGQITAGDWPSTVPEELVAKGRFGVFPNETAEEARNALVRCLDKVIAEDEWLHAHPPTLEWFEGQFEPGETSVNEPIIAALSAAHARVLQKDVVVQGVPYGSDLRLFTRYGKVPCTLYGPGDVAFAHTVEEHVEMDEVFACAKILALLIVDWCGSGNNSAAGGIPG